MEELHLNVKLLRARVPNLTVAARAAGLRAATVSNLTTGKIPISRAEVRTLAQLAELAGCTMDELVLRGPSHGMIETGVKTIDLFSPIVRGGIAGLVSRPGVGQLATVSELLLRLRRSGCHTVFRREGGSSAALDEIGALADEVCDSADQLPDAIRASAGNRHLVLAAGRASVESGELLRLQEQVVREGMPAFTVLLFDASGEAADEQLPFGPLDTYMRFDLELALRSCYPPVDPVVSTSVILEGAELEPLHLSIQQRARKLLRRYREWRPLVLARGMSALPDREHTVYARGERLEAYLTQPFYVAEPHTGKPGEWVALHETIEDVRRILDGEADAVEVRQLAFAGRISL